MSDDIEDLFTDNARWGDLADWSAAALALHERGGIHRIEREGFAPFWAVIDHAAILEIERKHELFTNAPQPVLLSTRRIEEQQLELRTLISMDAPDHGHYRNLTSPWFRPGRIRRLDERLDELSNAALDKLETLGGQCDFAVDIALGYPLQVILEILGLPADDYDLMLRLTQELFGGEDPDLQRDELTSETMGRVVLDLFRYFTSLTEERRANPQDDLASLIANGTVDGEPLPDLETLGYYVIVATAGHDTTSSAMSGGLHALIEHQDQLRRLQEKPELLTNAVEEMLRWTAPVRHFMRTAHQDTEILGQSICAGDWVYLSYKAANLDPKIFEDPLRFDIERSNADRNISFGYGVHFCLGAQLARNELRSLLGALVTRLKHIELAGVPRTSKTTFVGGHTSLPIRYELWPSPVGD